MNGFTESLRQELVDLPAAGGRLGQCFGAGGAALTAEDVVAWCREVLAPFKVPRHVEFRAFLPHTASGKIHKAGLREEEPFGPGVVDTQSSAAPA